jgi:hypothetical protein
MALGAALATGKPAAYSVVTHGVRSSQAFPIAISGDLWGFFPYLSNICHCG